MNLFTLIVSAIFKITERIGAIFVMQIKYNRTPYQRYDQSNCGQLYNFYRRLTINLRIDIALFQLSIHSNMSLTFTLTSKSVLASCYFLAIDLNDGEFGLTDFETYHTISNVNASNNKFYFDEKEIVNS